MYSLEAVLFDLYGTLLDITIDDARPELWETVACEFHGGDPAELERRYRELVAEERRVHGQPFVADGMLFRKLLNRSEAEARRFAWRFRELSTDCLHLRPYAMPLLRHLQYSGCKLALVSNTEASLTEYDLRQTGLRPLFDAVLLSSEFGHKKPDARIFLGALEQLHVSREAAVVVGDDLDADACGAENVGLRCVYVSNGHKVPPERMTANGSIRMVPPSRAAIEAALRDFGWRAAEIRAADLV